MASPPVASRIGEVEGKGGPTGEENAIADADHPSSGTPNEKLDRKNSATKPSPISSIDGAELEASGDVADVQKHNGADPSSQDKNGTTDAPPLPDESIPPLPSEPPPNTVAEQDDGWAPIWEESAQAFYFYNRFTGATQWTNPRVPEAPTVPATAPGVAPLPESLDPAVPATTPPPTTGYNPAIHGDYDPTAWYAQPSAPEPPKSNDPAAQYAASAAFNRFTGRFQNAELTPENFNDENKSKRQMNAFFDVDAAANSHDGRSLKAERSGKKLSKQELKQFKEKRKAKKEEKRRAWLRD